MVLGKWTHVVLGFRLGLIGGTSAAELNQVLFSPNGGVKYRSGHPVKQGKFQKQGANMGTKWNQETQTSGSMCRQAQVEKRHRVLQHSSRICDGCCTTSASQRPLAKSTKCTLRRSISSPPRQQQATTRARPETLDGILSCCFSQCFTLAFHLTACGPGNSCTRRERAGTLTDPHRLRLTHATMMQKTSVRRGWPRPATLSSTVVRVVDV